MEGYIGKFRFASEEGYIDWVGELDGGEKTNGSGKPNSYD